MFCTTTISLVILNNQTCLKRLNYFFIAITYLPSWEEVVVGMIVVVVREASGCEGPGFGWVWLGAPSLSEGWGAQVVVHWPTLCFASQRN